MYSNKSWQEIQPGISNINILLVLTLISPYSFIIMFAYSYVDDVVDYPPAQGGHQLYSTVEKKRLPSHDDDSTSGYPDIISTTQVG